MDNYHLFYGVKGNSRLIEKKSRVVNDLTKWYTASELADLMKVQPAFEDVNDRVDSFLELDAEVELLSVPAISDTYDPPTNEITRSCKRITPEWVALIKDDPEADFVVVQLEDGLGRGDSPAFQGLTTLFDKNGNEIPELSNQWGGEKAGTHYLTMNSYLWYYVPKGKYANLTAAVADLGDMTLTYALATSVVEQAPAFEYELDLSQASNFKISNDLGMEKEISLINPPQGVGKIISVSLLFDAVLATAVAFNGNIVWQNDLLPILEAGKSSLVILTSYDGGERWFGSIIGSWSL